MRLYLVRHSVREPNGQDDPGFDPALTDDGRQYVQNLADWMLDKDEVPNIIFASPTLRTQETAEILRDAFGLPAVETKASIGPAMSIKKLVEKVKDDKAMTRVAIVSHHETLEHGLRVLNLEPWIHMDIFAMCELRIVRVKRKSGKWEEHRRVPPSDLGGRDYY